MDTVEKWLMREAERQRREVKWHWLRKEPEKVTREDSR